jgi:NADH-quinone oxidoreductase subunit M
MSALLLATEAAGNEAAASFPVLSALVVLPILGALLLLLLPNSRPEYFKQVAFLVSAAVGGMAIWVLTDFQTGVHAAEFQLQNSHTWIESMGISWHLGIDGISLWLVVLTGLIFPIAIVAIDAEHEPKAYYGWLLVLEAGCMGVFLALDLFAFFVFFEIVLVPMYFLIGKWGHGERAYAATKFFIYTMFGSALMLVGILSLAFLNEAETGILTFNLVELAESQMIATTTARWIFLSFALAFAVKVPLFPVHTWLPDAHTNAPTAGSVILAAVMLKLGTYGFLRFGVYLFPEAAVFFAPALVTLGVIGIIYGAIAATMQHDLKRLVAYSSVAHLGFIVIGIFSLNTEGIEGGILQMVNHGLSTGALFLLVGWIYDRLHTRQISELGGLQKPAPIFAGVFMVVMLSSIGLPGLNGFVGETGVIIAALYLLWAYQRVFHGPAKGDNAKMKDLTLREGLIMLPFLVGIVFMGVYPKPVIERMEPAVDALIQHVEDHVDDFDEPVANIGVVVEDHSEDETEGDH